MKKTLLLLLSFFLITPINIVASEADDLSDHDHEHETTDSFEADDHHAHGTNYANFIPAQILNPDDSVYVAPEATADYVGLYTAEARVEPLNADVKIIMDISEDGLFNLAYYFVNDPEATGVRFYADADGQVHEREAVYQDLVVMTGALREGEGGLGTGLIGRTNSPVVLLDEQGEADRLYPYMSLAYDLRETYTNARVYQGVGVYLADDVVAVDVNHLIGLEDEDAIVARFALVEGDSADADAFLVADHVYEMLQYSFDNDLVEHNDFKMAFDSANDFLQTVLAMNLGTNTSFPQGTTVEALPADAVEVGDDVVVEYAVLINDALLYAYDAETSGLYMADAVEEIAGVYSAESWVTNQ